MTAIAPSPIDPIGTEVLARRLLAIAEEMAATLMRAAFSPNIKERGDCSTAIFDAAGAVVAQAQRVPIHLGSMLGVVEALLARHGAHGLGAGDMVLANDPYTGGGSHLPDLTLVAPVVAGGDLVGFVANIAHHADVGGMVPGSESALCRTIFQEGLRLPPVRLVRAGRIDPDLAAIVRLNARTPDERSGDLQAQVAANLVGARALAAVIARLGPARFAEACGAVLDATERRVRRRIAARCRPGTYHAADALDGDRPGETVSLRLALTVARNRLAFDFAGSAPAVAGSRNIPHQALLATVYTVVKSLLDPEVPANAGAFRPITVTAPASSVVGPTAPAAVGTRAISCGVLGDVVVNALSQAIPGHARAASGPHHLLVVSGTDPRSGRGFVNYETVAGGMGARAGGDGLDAVRVHASGAANLPIEALEHACPLRVVRYALRDGSGGAGQWRGGAGVVRAYQALADGLVVSLAAERQTVAAAGAAGGAAGATGRFELTHPGAAPVRLPVAVAECALPVGAVLSIATPGGGGVGPEAARAAATHARDARERRLAATTPTAPTAAAPRSAPAPPPLPARAAPAETDSETDSETEDAAAFAAARRRFPGALDRVYLDVASRGLVSIDSVAAIEAYLADRISARASKSEMFALINRVRARFAALIGAAPDEIALTRNVSDGLTAFALAVPWRVGDEVVLCRDIEHPNNVYPWLNLARRHGVVVRTVAAADGMVAADRLIAALTPRTRLVAVSSVSFAPGLRTDLETLGAACRAAGVLLLVDGAQSVGVLGLDVGATAIDGLAVATQKGLLGLYGLGFLYCRRAVAEQLSPAALTRFGVDLGDAHEAALGDRGFAYAPGARRFDLGNPNFVAAAALEPALDLLHRLGSGRIERVVTARAARLAEGLASLGLPVVAAPTPAARGHIVAIGRFNPSGGHDRADDPTIAAYHQTLTAAGVVTAVRRGLVRCSLHLYNDDADIDRVLAVSAAAWQGPRTPA